MNNLVSEFQALSQLYLQIEQEISGVMSAQDPKDSQLLARSILRNRECLARIEQMNSRVLCLSNEWKKHRADLDPQTRNETEALAAAVRAQIARITSVFDGRARVLIEARNRLEKELEEIGKGGRYLKSIKPVQNNYPKFIDSVY